MPIYSSVRRFLPICVVAIALCACGDDDGNATPDPDAGSDAAVPIDGSDPCTDDDQCDDGSFCNGTEFCDETQCKRGVAVNCDDGIECTTDICSDSMSSCRHLAPDFDRDEHADALCLDKDGEPVGDDCDDENANRYPGNIEVCDVENVDEDCDATTIGAKDQDGDGATDNTCCNRDEANALVCGTDCDDLKASVNPSASEVCDLFDNDCDGRADEAGAVPLYPDADFDGHGSSTGVAQQKCAGTLGFSSDQIDCDDTDPAVHGAQVEICDAKDNDCDMEIDESPRAVYWYADLDGDGFGGRLEAAEFSCIPVPDRDLRDNDCDDDNAAINPAAAELCDGIDNNCDGRKTASIAVNNFEDDDSDGSPDFECGVGGNDCDDNNGATGGDLIEICDKLDNDCDTKVDENVADTVWYMDLDGDGYGNERLPAVVFCAPLAGRTAYPGDCDDDDGLIHPGAFEVCDLNLVSTGDEDCDGRVDEGFCPKCGDGIPEGPEQCDERAPSSTGACVDPDGVCNDDTLVDACRSDCTYAHCGDDVLDTDEICDDGAMNSGDADAACRPDCTLRRCGDRVVDSNEYCEPGVGVDGASCANDCTFEGWEATGCTSVAPADIGSAVGTVVTGADTGSGTNQIVFDPASGTGLNNCGFTGSAPTGPELAYRWSAPGEFIYAIRATNGGLTSRLTVGVFTDGGEAPTSCTVPQACLELDSVSSSIKQIRNGQAMVLVVDSQSAQVFDLEVRPLLCCVADPLALQLPNLGACATSNTQADLDCALTATAADPTCLDHWSPACIAAADLACAYACP